MLPTLGSSGDVHPFIALGRAMQQRGHRVTVLTNPLFQALIESQGLEFLALGKLKDAQVAIGNPDVWHLRKGFAIIASVIVPAIAETYRHIEQRADSNTVVAFSTLAFGGRVAQEKLGVPSASVHLQPSIIRTYADQGMLGNIRLSAAHPRWMKQVLFSLVDALVLDRHLKQPLNRFRATLGLAPVARVMDRWMNSPRLVLAMFPQWFAAPQPDWPANTHTVGFAQFDDDGASDSLQRAEEFLAAGAPPMIVTPGSAGSTMQRFFRESVDAANRIGARAMLVTNFPEQVPRHLPSGIQVFGYLPFSRLLPRASLMVYHGGIGTLAQGIKAGVRHLVVPHGYDQFDSGWRIEQLGLGRCIPDSRYRAARVAPVMRQLLDDASLMQRCRQFSSRVDSPATLAHACELLESIAAPVASPSSHGA
ncbi:MAG: rhamnosyltransferase subunit [Gammaproteobacteria bacterium]|jgi:rhamnosyltransferase subunit B|nr:rhamnosyltransferase subunit [Gammaproteobacteria bacterium]